MKKICRSCGHIGNTKTEIKGSIAMELVLWLCFIIPGLIYSVWRLTTKYEACEVCHSGEVIPLDSPVAKQIAEATQQSNKVEAAEDDNFAYKLGLFVKKFKK